MSNLIKSNHKLFADDTSLYASVNHESKHDKQRMIENDLKNIESSSKQWLVKFNTSKIESHVSLLIYILIITSHLNNK